VTPQVSLLPEKLRAENILPGQIEVVIERGRATPSPTPGATPTKKP